MSLVGSSWSESYPGFACQISLPRAPRARVTERQDPHLRRGVQAGPLCNGIAFRILERPVITWAQVIGIVFVLLGRRILDGKPGVSGRGNEPQVQSPSCRKGIKLLSLALRNQTSE